MSIALNGRHQDDDMAKSSDAPCNITWADEREVQQMRAVLPLLNLKLIPIPNLPIPQPGPLKGN
jgi:hypothetical protein